MKDMQEIIKRNEGCQFSIDGDSFKVEGGQVKMYNRAISGYVNISRIILDDSILDSICAILKGNVL